MTLPEDSKTYHKQLTRENTQLKLVVAFNYGAKQELARAAQSLARAALEGTLQLEDITVETFEQALDTAGLPAVDLLIRTGGEQRISNYLLWQCAYAEFVFTDQFWPDFDASSLRTAIDEFKSRDRRFGSVRAELA